VEQILKGKKIYELAAVLYFHSSLEDLAVELLRKISLRHTANQFSLRKLVFTAVFLKLRPYRNSIFRKKLYKGSFYTNTQSWGRPRPMAAIFEASSVFDEAQLPPTRQENLKWESSEAG
jgi:hypothetical protein